MARVHYNNDSVDVPATRSGLESLLKDILSRYAIIPNRKKSQNFCIDPALLSYLVGFAELDRERDKVLEIGGGLGFLTRLLASHSMSVVSIEKDPNLALLLERQVSSCDNVEIINADFLETNLSRFDYNCIVANPPYSISSPVVFKILEEKPVKTIMTFQKEFVSHLVAGPDNKKYSRLSVAVSFYATVETGRIFSPKSFFPSPAVDSQVVKILPLTDGSRSLHIGFKTFLRAVFARKHKKVSGNLISYLKSTGKSKQEARTIVSTLVHPDLSERAARLSPDRLYDLFEEVAAPLGLSLESD